MTSPDDSPAHTLAGELRVLIGRLRRRVRELADPGDLTWSQTSVLSLIDREGPATVSTLARAEGVRPQSMGATIAALEAAGLVTGAPDPSDGRQTIISLTPACREWVRAGRAAREDWLFRAIQAELSADEQAKLSGVVDLLRRIADSPPQDGKAR
jgi:DNA-binding MarR family transcriptional regulator